jgi:hypothetical protein
MTPISRFYGFPSLRGRELIDGDCRSRYHLPKPTKRCKIIGGVEVEASLLRKKWRSISCSGTLKF